MKVPSDLPLEDGKITCLTCHDDHFEEHAVARMEHTSLLRPGYSAAKLCVQCHIKQDSRASSHARAIGKAHLLSPRTENATTKADKYLDASSETCLACHDGLVSSDVSPGSLHAGLGEHPVDMRYDDRTESVSRNRFVPMTLLDPRIRLFDEHVACASCHSLFSQERHLTVVANEGSGLCLGCHKM